MTDVPAFAPPSSADPTPAAAPAEPYSITELQLVLRRPGSAFDLVLARRDRLAATITTGSAVWWLALVLLACTALASLPYGFVRGTSAWWKVGVLFSGSVLLCYPALQVFGAYLGSRMQPAQNLALALVVSSVAALFTLGFFPIAWFLGQTMQAGDWIDANVASVVMLGAALLAGLLQLSRCLVRDASLRTNGLLLAAWQFLVVCVALRMARALDLLW